MKLARHYQTVTEKALDAKKARDKEAAMAQLRELEPQVEGAANDGKFTFSTTERLLPLTVAMLIELGYATKERQDNGNFPDASRPIWDISWGEFARPVSTERRDRVFVVIGKTGQYEDTTEWYVCAFGTHEDALDLSNRLNAWCRDHGCDARPYVGVPTDHPPEDPAFRCIDTGVQYHIHEIPLYLSGKGMSIPT